jgi:heme oxygenase (biliverdin-producing, ferredoxin)
MSNTAEPTLSLAERLRSATQAMHRRVERSTFMARLLQGEVDRSLYISLMHNLQALYSALEQALLRHAAHPAVGPVVMPELFRSTAIEADLRLLRCATDNLAPPLQTATLDYVQRLGTLDTTAPDLLVAHAYVRYLGDLNGGQALRRVVARALQLDEGAGTTFYDFGDTLSCQRLMLGFRHGLAMVELQCADQDALVAEAVSAFERHGQLFAQLSAPTP